MSTESALPETWPYVMQRELAGFLGVQCHEVGRWQDEGLPHEKQGRRLLFHGPFSVNWSLGRSFLRKRGMIVPVGSPLMVAVLAPLLQLHAGLGSTADAITSAKRLGEAVGATSSELLEAVAEAAVLRMRW